MNGDLLQLYPPPTESLPLTGLYLDHPLHRIQADAPLVYSNFVTSLDGRIALPRPGQTSHGVPPEIGNARDWRLYQELAAQADLLITSARYFRQYASGEAQDHLPVGPADKFADLCEWRLAQGMTAQPDIAIFSASLDIPEQSLRDYSTRKLHVLTGAAADPERVATLQALGVQVHVAGKTNEVEGRAAIDCLHALGYQHIYVIAGPSVFHTLVTAGAIDRLYLTLAQRLLGGQDFDTLTWGSALKEVPSLKLRSLFFDAYAPDDAGQMLASYDF